MHSKDLTTEILSNQVFNLQGGDSYWLNNCNDFFSRLISDENRDVNIKIYNQLQSLEDIIFSLSSFGFNDETQLIIVKDKKYKASKDELKNLREVIKEGIEPYILVFENVEFLTATDKKLMITIDCTKLEKFDLIPIIEKKCASYGGIEKRAAYLLIDYTNNEMAKINLECNKLIDYAENKLITADMVETLVNEDTELQIYQFVNSIVEGKKEQAVVYLDKLTKKGEAKSYILASLINQYRRILHSAISPKTNAELASIFGVKEYAIKKAREINNKSKMTLKKTLEMLINYEYKFKSGIMNESTAFDTAVSKLLA